MDTGTPADRSRARRRAVVAAVVVLVLAVVAVVVYLQTRPTHPSAGTGPVRYTPAPSVSSSAAPASTSAVSSTDTSTAGLSVAPTGVTWQLFQTIALPVSASDGPTRIDGPVVAGYSHTPTGALLAAAQISARFQVTPDGGWRQVLNEQVMPGTGRDVYASERVQVNDDIPSGGYAQYAGFQFVTYSPDLAVIGLVARNSGGGLAVSNITVQWFGGDWKMQLPPTGGVGFQAVQTLAGFVPWAGVS